MQCAAVPGGAEFAVAEVVDDFADRTEAGDGVLDRVSLGPFALQRRWWIESRDMSPAGSSHATDRNVNFAMVERDAVESARHERIAGHRKGQ